LWNDKPNKKRQKDVDARWSKKNKQTFFCYTEEQKLNNTEKSRFRSLSYPRKS
jgi:hypothetical protein